MIPDSNDVPLREQMVSSTVTSSAKNRVNFISRLFKRNTSLEVLDVGCEEGGFLKALKDRFDCKPMGIDLDEKATQFCKNHLNLNVISGCRETI